MVTVIKVSVVQYCEIVLKWNDCLCTYDLTIIFILKNSAKYLVLGEILIFLF